MEEVILIICFHISQCVIVSVKLTVSVLLLDIQLLFIF